MFRLIAGMAAAMLIPAAAPAQDAAVIELGKYLVDTSGCHDCHTPWGMGPNGPAPDMSRALSGHPEDFVITEAPKLPEPWIAGFVGTNTAWAGPWGVSFTVNLTPDPETGALREFTEEQFLEALRTGRHQGKGRPILPPMPWEPYGKKTDEELKAIFAYLKQIPPVRNKVPDPLPPAQ